MKYALTLLFGFLTGVALAVTGLYFNPLTRSPGPIPLSDDSVFAYGSPLTAELAFTHGRLSRLPSYPAGVPDLWEKTINKSALSVVHLRGDDGVSGIASRISYPGEDSELLRNGALLNDDWVVSIPGQGSFFISSQSNWWPFLRDMLIPVWYLGRPWSGPSAYSPTVGPASGVWALVSGASGSFAGRTGTATERYEIEEFDDRVGLNRANAQIYWRFDEPVGGATAVAEAP